MSLSDLKLSFKKEDIIKNRILLIGIAMALISVWYAYNIIYKSAAETIRQINAEIAREAVNTDVSKRLATQQRVLETYQAAFVKGADMSWLVNRVSKAANEAGLNIKALNSKPLSTVKSFLYSSVNLTATGTFHNLGDFVSRVERSKEFIRIEKLSFSKEEKFLNADIVISTYFSR